MGWGITWLVSEWRVEESTHHKQNNALPTGQHLAKVWHLSFPILMEEGKCGGELTAMMEEGISNEWEKSNPSLKDAPFQRTEILNYILQTYRGKESKRTDMETDQMNRLQQGYRDADATTPWSAD